nr:sulfotransferase [Chiayiivirga flava]
MAAWPDAENLDIGRLLLSAQVAQAVGERAQAQARFAAAIRRFPDSVDAWQKAVEARAAAGPDVATHLQAWHRRTTSAYEREKTAFALATLLDADAPNEAFAWASTAHALKRQRIGTWNGDAFEADLAIDRRWSPATAGDGASPRPVFIVGLPRSGTTLLSALLGAHPDVAQAGEQNLIPTLANGPCRSPAQADAERLHFCARWYRAAVGDMAHGAGIVVDKLPANAAHIGLILALFPDALVLHCRRSLADTAISIWQHDFEFGCAYGNHIDDLARYAHALRAHVEHWHAREPARVVHIDYEAVVDDAEAALAAPLHALGLRWRDDMTQFWRATQPVATHSEAQLRAPINRNSVERWRRYVPAADGLLTRIAAG